MFVKTNNIVPVALDTRNILVLFWVGWAEASSFRSASASAGAVSKDRLSRTSAARTSAPAALRCAVSSSESCLWPTSATISKAKNQTNKNENQPFGVVFRPSLLGVSGFYELTCRKLRCQLVAM